MTYLFGNTHDEKSCEMTNDDLLGCLVMAVFIGGGILMGLAVGLSLLAGR